MNQRHPVTNNSRQTVVLLGASNLTLAWPAVAHCLQSGLNVPVDLFVALGLGRSYVNWSRFMARQLPGIRGCHLFPDLARHMAALSESARFSEPCGRQCLSPLVLLTDIGNDLMYGYSPERIIDSLEDCLARLKRAAPDSRVLITGLPVTSVQRLSWLRFVAARTVLYPACRLNLNTVMERTSQLEAAVRALAGRHQALLVEPNDGWYGIDPIHIRRSDHVSAFSYIFGHWQAFQTGRTATGASTAFPGLPRPLEWRSLGRRRIAAQPCFASERLTVYGY